MTKRSINSVKIILEFSQSKGFESTTLLDGTGIDSSILADNYAQIDDQQELTVLSNLLKLIPDPFRLGVELGNRYQLTSYGIVGFALLSSATYRKATTLGLRYITLTYAFSNIELKERGKSSALSFSCDIPGDLGVLVLIRDIWAVNVIKRELFAGDTIPFELQLICNEPDYCKQFGKANLEKSLGGSLCYNSESNAYVVSAEIMDLPLPKANDITASICEKQCRELLYKKQKWQAVSLLVRDTILHKGLNVSMEDVTSILARTSRTLHRQLKEEGTSWRRIRDDVRMGLAEKLLTQPIQLDEISERLGFSDAASFSISFKRCKGMSPKAYKKQLLKGGAAK